MQSIAVTGGSGGAGHFVISDLLASGYKCVNLDVKEPTEELCEFRKVDMCNYKQVFEALEGCDGIVHFAGNPHPDDDHWGAADRFSNNTNSLFNAFNAAQAHGIKRVVWASSETIFGFPFENNLPQTLPLTEQAKKAPQNGYALSKAISENLAELMAELYDMTFIGLRLSNVLYDDEEAIPSFQKIPSYWDDLGHRKFNLWGYIDARDSARACRLALESDLTGAHVFSIAAKDTIMKQQTSEVVGKVMPGVELHAGLKGRDAALDCNKAKILLGFEPEYSWQGVLGLNEDGTPQGNQK